VPLAPFSQAKSSSGPELPSAEWLGPSRVAGAPSRSPEGDGGKLGRPRGVMSGKRAAEEAGPAELATPGRGSSGGPASGASGGWSIALAAWRSIPYPGLLVGVVLFAGLLVEHGIAGLVGDLTVVGWGLAVLAGYHLVSTFVDALAWRRLIAAGERPPLFVTVVARWIGESVNALLPVMQLGGNVVRATLLARRGVRGVVAGASVVVDVTLEALTQLLFAILGIVLLISGARGEQLFGPILLGTGAMALVLAAFLFAQRRGLFGAAVRAIGRVTGSRRSRGLGAEAEALDAGVAAMYGDRRAILAGSGWHLAGWLLGVGEVWMAMRFLGHPVDLASAVVLESLGSAVRAAAFAIPGALGVQEGGFVVLGGALGIPPQTCLALSLCKRAREVLLGLPALAAWQIDSGRSSARPRQTAG
jgi:putative membrane protein